MVIFIFPNNVLELLSLIENMVVDRFLPKVIISCQTAPVTWKLKSRALPSAKEHKLTDIIKLNWIKLRLRLTFSASLLKKELAGWPFTGL